MRAGLWAFAGTSETLGSQGTRRGDASVSPAFLTFQNLQYLHESWAPALDALAEVGSYCLRTRAPVWIRACLSCVRESMERSAPSRRLRSRARLSTRRPSRQRSSRAWKRFEARERTPECVCEPLDASERFPVTLLNSSGSPTDHMQIWPHGGASGPTRRLTSLACP